MTRKRISENKNSQRQTRGRDAIPWKYCLLTLGCGTLLVVGFFLAARQHFSSIDFGIKNSKLRKQIENLEADKRRFILAKEIALSPGEIKKAAQKLGFREMSASNIEVYQPVNETKEDVKTAPPEKSKPNNSSETGDAKKADKKEDKKPEKETKKEAKKDEDKAEKKNSEVKQKPKTQIAKK